MQQTKNLVDSLIAMVQLYGNNNNHKNNYKMACHYKRQRQYKISIGKEQKDIDKKKIEQKNKIFMKSDSFNRIKII